MKLALQCTAVALVALLGCSNKPAEPRPEPAPAAAPATVAEVRPSAPVAAPAAPTAAPVADTGMPSDFPPSCVAYAALIDKLATCEKVGNGREGLARGYRELRATWPTITAAQRGAFDAQCKTQADSLRNAAAATCGW